MIAKPLPYEAEGLSMRGRFFFADNHADRAPRLSRSVRTG
jgi:hypothetical protein